MTQPPMRAEPRARTSIDPLTRFWWVRVPLAARRISTGSFLTMTDGWQVVLVPSVGAWLPLVAVVVGLLFGATHITFGVAFSESLLFVALAVIIGVTGGQLGVWLTLGFALGDFFIAHPDWAAGDPFAIGGVGIWQHLATVRAPLLIQYGLLALLTTGVPAAIRVLLGQLGFVARLPFGLAFWLLAAGHALLAWVLVYFWSQAIAVLVVPAYTWAGSFSSADPSTINLQDNGASFAILGSLAAVVRFVLQARALGDGPAAERSAALVSELNSATPVLPLADRVPLVARLLARTLWATLLLAGLYAGWIDAIVLGVIIGTFQMVRAGWIALPLGRWPEVATRIPLLIRLGVGFAFIWVVSLQLHGLVIADAADFRPLALLTGVSMAVFLVLAPPMVEPRRGAMDR